MTVIQNGTLRPTKICCSQFNLAEADSSEKTCQFASNTASEPCWKLAKHWLSSCRSDHTRCTKFLSETPFHPTRLIEIATSASASDNELYLRMPGEHSPEVHYMTLSHCWGKGEFLKLTKTTFQRLRDGFSAVETLSKTFQDAIIICREFGVRYLWIDSLCIFQDSPEDWRCEAAQMGQVYENSLCNIAATGASNDEEGCFKDRDESLLRRCIIKSEWNNQKNGTWEIIANDFWDTRINRAPLNKRGWVMQERWLSPRVLHYGRDQILWECNELDACETYPGGLPKPLRHGRSGFKLDPETKKRMGYWKEDYYKEPDPDSLHRSIWSSIVSSYSVTTLTKGEDKLVAISGIAKRMQSLLDDEYLAGLWRKDLPCQLLWTVNDHDPAYFVPPTRPRPYRAPSWSWASVDAPVAGGGGYNDGIIITILDAVVTPVGADSTGQIKDGFIRLNGRIFPAELVRPSGRHPRITVRVDSEVFETFCEPDTKPEALGVLSVYLLPILSYDYENTPWLMCLVLYAAPQGNGTYERIGSCNFSDEKACSALQQSEAFTDKWLYENADGETIVLI